MPKTRKTLQLKNLARYDVFIEDRSVNSPYFQISNLPSLFGGGRNSFLIAGSELLVPGSTIQIEILDTSGNPVYQNPIKNYTVGNSVLISVEIDETITRGFATLILMGQARVTDSGDTIPSMWENKYNVRWVKKILVEPANKSTSPLIFENNPILISEETRLHSVSTSSYTSSSVNITASLSPILYTGQQIGYLINTQSPTTLSAGYINPYITGSVVINNSSKNIYIPISNIINNTTALSLGKLITNQDDFIIDKILLYSGSYNTEVFGASADITSSIQLVYSQLNTQASNVPVSYAKLRAVNLNTVSGELYKLKVYSKVTTNLSDYKLIADVPVITSELLVSSSIRGDISIGDIYLSPNVNDNWYSYRLDTSSNVIYPISGSPEYYNPNTTITSFSFGISDNVLLRSIKAEVPIYNNQQYDGYVSQSGYFIGTKRSVTLFPTTEYTLEFDAFYTKSSGSVNLIDVGSKVDIYIVGVNGTIVVDNNPLGQNIGTITTHGVESQLFENQQFNFTPKISVGNQVGIRFVVNNGFWYFSNISLKPASDALFAPDEIQILVPNTDFYNELLQHKIEFFDINNNSTNVSVESVPTFFTGSVIDLGTIS